MSVRRAGARVTVSAIVVGAMAVTGLVGARPAAAEDPVFVGWSDLLPTFTHGYDPTSANECTSGKVKCVEKVIKEMDRRFRPLVRDCDHSSMFALTYLRTTEEYLRSATTPGFFTDPGFVNHQDAVFAQYYFDAWDDYRSASSAEVSQSWRIAFEQADRQQVAGIGNLLLGMSAHVNRDLPLVLAEIGLVKPDGSSRKPDHDKVNQFLNLVIEPLFDEAAARLDPTVDDGQIDGTTMDETGSLQLLVGWRERAWRNAESIANATTDAQRQMAVAQIERTAAIEANLIVVATAYSPLNVQQALSNLSALGAPPAATAQAQADRAVNAARGFFDGLGTSAAAVRNAYCQANA